MALLRFSAPIRSSDRRLATARPGPNRRPGSRAVRPRAATVPCGRVSPAAAFGVPFQSFPPGPEPSRLPDPPALMGFPAPRSHAIARPLQGLGPRTECLAVLEGPLVALLGFIPLGPSPPSPWHPVLPGLLLLRASCPAARRPAVPGTLKFCVAMEAASPFPAPALLGFVRPLAGPLREASLAQLRVLKDPLAGEAHCRASGALGKHFLQLSLNSQQVTTCPPVIHIPRTDCAPIATPNDRRFPSVRRVPTLAVP